MFTRWRHRRSNDVKDGVRYFSTMSIGTKNNKFLERWKSGSREFPSFETRLREIMLPLLASPG